jgi:PAS domain S-box-containing protein
MKYLKSFRLLITILLIVNVAIVLITVRYFLLERERFKNEKDTQLQTLSEIKVRQITDWRHERLSDANFLLQSNVIAEYIKGLSADSSKEGYRQGLFGILNAMYLNGKYENMTATDIQGKTLLSIPESKTKRVLPVPGNCENAWDPGHIFMGDMIRVGDSAFALEIPVPVCFSSSFDTIQVGWLLLTIDPEKDFFPLLMAVPFRAEMLDILLVRGGKDEVVFINKPGFPTLHFTDQDARNIWKDLPAFMAVNGFTGTIEGISSKRKPVVAFVQDIPESNWFLIVEMDKAAAYAEIGNMRISILVFSMLLILSITSSISFFWLKQQTEMENLESERNLLAERFDLLSKFANDAILLYNSDLVILQVNDRVLENYGYTREELMGMSADKLISSRSRQEINETITDIIREGGHRFETMHLRKDGSVFPVEVSTRHIEIGGKGYFQSIVRDIFQRKQVEAALLESEERMRLITNSMPQIVWTANPDGNIDYVNSRFEALTGVFPFKYNAMRKSLHPDDKERVLKSWKVYTKKSSEFQFEFRLLMSGGHYHWFLNKGVPLRNPDGTIMKWFGSATDINDLKTTQEALVNSLAKSKKAELAILELNAELEERVANRTAELSDLYNNAPCGYHSLDSAGNYIMINDTELKWLGYTREEIDGKRNFSEMITADSLTVFQQAFPIFKDRGEVNNLQFEMVRKDGSILPVLLSGTAIYDEGGNFVMSRSTIMDMTQRLKYENEILKLNQILQDHGHDLEMANKELEAFSYSVSHDLRAPLRAIDGFSKILLADHYNHVNAEGQRLLHVVSENAQRMGRLIDDLLKFSRTGRKEMTISRIKMTELFTSICAELIPAYPEQRIEMNFSDLPDASGDLSLLKLVVNNLLSNAIKFSGKRDISIIEIGSYSTDNELVYFVKDNGTGFDMRFSSKLFGVFQRLHSMEDFSGTGVGLALVKRIVDRHGGRIWAESELDKGAVFYFSLPLETNKTMN